MTATAAISIEMGEYEARECVQKIKDALHQAEFHFEQGQKFYDASRQHLWNLHEYHGWRALGYTSWSACVEMEFQKKSSILYKRLAAAAIEQQVNPTVPLGTIPERVLRPLAKKQFTEDTRRALWEIATTVAGSPASVTSGLMQSVVDTLSEALVTGTLQNSDGEQSSIFEKVREDVLNRTVESRKRHQEYLNGSGVKILSSVDVKPHISKDKRVLLEVSDIVTPEQLKLLTNGKLRLKLSVWGKD